MAKRFYMPQNYENNTSLVEDAVFYNYPDAIDVCDMKEILTEYGIENIDDYPSNTIAEEFERIHTLAIITLDLLSDEDREILEMGGTIALNRI